MQKAYHFENMTKDEEEKLMEYAILYMRKKFPREKSDEFDRLTEKMLENSTDEISEFLLEVDVDFWGRVSAKEADELRKGRNE